MTIALETHGSALARASAASPRRRGRRRLIYALGIAAIVHAAIGYEVWQAKFQPHYQEVAAAQAMEAHLVQPPPPPPPPPPPKQQPKVERTPHPTPTPRAPPPPRLTPRPTVAKIPAPEVLPIAPAPAPVKEPPTLAAPAPPAPEPAPQPAPERTHIVTNPDWLRTPDADDLARYYPQEAQRQGVGGQATLSCGVSEAGSLVGCSVAAETPKGQGFGGAALKMAGDFKMRPETRDGVPVAGGKIRIPIKFQMPDQS